MNKAQLKNRIEDAIFLSREISVASLAETLCISESRIREVMKEMTHLVVGPNPNGKGKVYSLPAKDEPKVKAKPEGKRVVLNPQPVINKKRVAIETLGGSLRYEGRKWTVTLNGKSQVMTSREFSEATF